MDRDSKKVKNFIQFINEDNEDNATVIGELRDYLASSCRDWQIDSYNYDDTITLTNHLQDRFPSLSFDVIYNIAKHWTGYEEPEEE